MLNVGAERTLIRRGNHPGVSPAIPGATTERGARIGARFAVTKFRPTTLPSMLATRSALHDRLTTGAGQDFGELKHIDGVGPGW